MGVGEDDDLGESVAVTVIATGFDIDQQDNIVNSEAKKIIHTLNDEQRASQDLMPKSVVYQLVEEEVKVEEPVLKHTLSDELDDLDLIPTTNYIKNFNVF